MTRGRNRGPRRGSRRVEGWIYGVINPILDALPTEISFLDSGNVTWRFLWRKLEFIRPVKDYLSPQGSHILTDLERSQKDVPDPLRRHDDLVRALADSAAHFHDALVASPDFEQTVWRSVKEFAAQEDAQSLTTRVEPWGAFRREQFPSLVAEHVVNCTREIPPHHTDARFWEAFGKRFLEFRTNEACRRLDDVRTALTDYDRHLHAWLENKRFELCEEYDIPAAPLSSWVSQTV